MIFFLIGFCAYLFLVALPPIWDTDFWWHLRVGEWIVQNGHVPTLDMFSSVHPEREWMTFNWLFEVLIYGLHETIGLMGIRIFFAAVVVLGFLSWFRYFRRETKNNSAACMLLLVLLLMFADRLRIRPHLINLPFEAWLAIFLQSGTQLKNWKQRFCFFGAGLLWSNFHNPCAAMGAGVVCLSSAIHVVFAKSEHRMKELGERFWPPLLSILAILCNPYGPSLLLSAKNNIAPVYHSSGEGEWQPPLTKISFNEGFVHAIHTLLPIVAFLMLAGFLIFRYFRKKSLDSQRVRHAAAPIGYLTISQTAMRFTYLSVPSLAWMMGSVNLQSKKIQRTILCISVALCALLFHYQIMRQGGPSTILSNLSLNVWPGNNPDVAAKLIREIKLQGKIFTLTPAGSYLLWFAHPEGGVSSDGRSNVTSEVLAMQNIVGANLGLNASKILHVLDEMKMDIAVLPFGSFPFHHWPIHQWIRIAYDQTTEVFLRNGSIDMEKVEHWLHTQSSDPEKIQNIATQFWGNRFYASKKSRIAALMKSQSEDDIHELAFIERMSDHDSEAIAILAQHLKNAPSCIRAATELAEILHDEGKYSEALELLSPVQNIKGIPQPTAELLGHLKTHIHP